MFHCWLIVSDFFVIVMELEWSGFYPATDCVNKTCSGSFYRLRRKALGV